MSEAIAAMMRDARLSTDARVIGFEIARRGEGAHEITMDELADVLSSEASRERAGRAVSQLARYSWVHRKAGGRGHADTFAFSMAGAPEVKPLSNPAPPEVKAVVVEEAEDVTDNPLPPLSKRAAEVIEKRGALLEGCRDALIDYLRAHVPTETRQYSYVQLVVSWMQDADPSVWRLATGGWLAKEERPKTLALALNGLGAGEEKGYSRPVGDPDNAKTKINILLKQRARYDGRERTDTRRSGATGRAAGASATDTPVTDINNRRRRSFGAEPAA